MSSSIVTVPSSALVSRPMRLSETSIAGASSALAATLRRRRSERADPPPRRAARRPCRAKTKAQKPRPSRDRSTRLRAGRVRGCGSRARVRRSPASSGNRGRSRSPSPGHDQPERQPPYGRAVREQRLGDRLDAVGERMAEEGLGAALVPGRAGRRLETRSRDLRYVGDEDTAGRRSSAFRGRATVSPAPP